MCGIAGHLLHAPVTPPAHVIEAMSAALRYRGPDDDGVFLAPHIALAHRRLTIRDLTDAGHCPMASGDGTVQLVFNGEIYNWRELRDQLAEEGHRFSSQSDTEVVLEAYLRWGADFVTRLRGMFAMAIWDGRSQQLFLARDRVGEKPLFYTSNATGLAFASAIEALSPALPDRSVDGVALAAYLAHGFIPASHTIWNEVNVLPPAHFMVVEVGQTPRIVRYWDFPDVAPIRTDRRSAETRVETALQDCIARCLDADVPVGVFLSGGVDSSLIAAMAARLRPGLPAFSIGFAEADHDELPFARKVADDLGLDHVTLELTEDHVVEALPHLVRQYGQPFGDSSSVPSYWLAKLARERVTVCLSGDGGDESFGGYWRVQAGVYAARYGRAVPKVVRDALVPSVAGRLGGLGERIKALNSLSLQAPGAGYTNSQSWLNQISSVAGPALTPFLHTDLRALRVGVGRSSEHTSIVQRLLYDDFQIQLPDAYLTKVDVASMSASLEVRAPFLDHVFLEMAWTLPDDLKLNWGRRKWLLKRIAAQYVDPSIVYRPKMGFAMPLASWFRGSLGLALEDVLRDSLARSAGWLRVEPVLDALHRHRNGEDHSTRLWLALWLETWFRVVAEDTKASG